MSFDLSTLLRTDKIPKLNSISSFVRLITLRVIYDLEDIAAAAAVGLRISDRTDDKRSDLPNFADCHQGRDSGMRSWSSGSHVGHGTTNPKAGIRRGDLRIRLRRDPKSLVECWS